MSVRERRGRAGRSVVPALCAAGVALLVAGAAVYAREPAVQVQDLGVTPVAATPVAATWPPGWPRPVRIYPQDRPRPALRGVVPVAVRLPGRAAATVQPEGVGADGALGLPDDVRRVGWWSGGARLGAPQGPVVLAGHVDAAAQGTGYLAAIDRLAAGAVVTVRGADGVDRAFTVVSRRSYRKEALPASIFETGTAPRLVLITCTGTFDRARRSYDSNLVVIAHPR